MPAPSRFDAILTALRDATGAARVTLRLDVPHRGLHSRDVAGEALAPGVTSLRGQTSIDQRAAGTIRWLEANRRPLIQPDLRGADPAPPRELVELYGATAQMLGPIVRDDRLVGWVSIHHAGGPRRWRAEDVAALEEAMREVHRELDADG